MAITYNATAPTFNLKEIGSEDIKNGIEAQATAETLRRKKALADAFSKSIVTEPVVADSDKYDSNGNKVQLKGQILTSPGDVDQQKFFKHVSDAGLGFDEAKAVYDHYQMQKDSALHALKTGMEIDTLGGGSGVPTRANAPIITASPAPSPAPAPSPVIPTQAPVSAPAQTPASNELEGKTDFEKISILDELLKSKNKDDVKKAQTILGATVDGAAYNRKTKTYYPDTSNAYDQLKKRMIEANLKKDTTEGAQNRVYVIAGAGAQSKGPEGKLTIDDASDSTPAKIGSVVDNRTALQRIEDRGASSNFGIGTETQGYKPGDVKVRDISGFPKYIQDNLKQQGLSTDKMQTALDLRLASIPAPSKINEKGEVDGLGYRQRQAIYNAKLKEAEDGFYKDIATGNAAAIARDLASDSNRMAKIVSKREDEKYKAQQTALDEMKNTYGVDKATVDDLPKLREIAGKKEKTKTLVKTTQDLYDYAAKNPNASMEERETRTKVIDNLLRQSDNITTNAGNSALFSTISRIAPSWKSALYNADGSNKKLDLFKFLAKNIGELSFVQQAKMYKSIAEEIDRNGSAENELKPYRSSGAEKGLGKGLKKKDSNYSKIKTNASGDKIGLNKSTGKWEHIK